MTQKRKASSAPQRGRKPRRKARSQSGQQGPRDTGAIEKLCDQLAQRELTLAELETFYIAAVLRREGGHKSKAAERLDINRTTLYRRGV